MKRDGWRKAPSDYVEKLDMKDFVIGGIWWIAGLLFFLCAAAMVSGCGNGQGQERAKFGGNGYTRVDVNEQPCYQEDGAHLTTPAQTPDKADPCPKHEITDLPKLCEVTLASGKQVVFKEPAQVLVMVMGGVSYYYMGVKLTLPVANTWVRVDRVENENGATITFKARHPE